MIDDDSPRGAGYPDPVWRNQHPKEALSCDLLVELGYEPGKILSRSSRIHGVLDVEGDRCVRLEILDLNERGGVHYVRRPSGGFEAAHHVEFVDVAPERLAKYRADIEALS